MLMNLPNVLTLLRIVCIPIILLLMWWDTSTGNICALTLYTIACITDFLDGYFARSWHQMSLFGRTLDPIADKLLISLCLLILVGLDRLNHVHLIPTSIILSREILVSGLREFLASIPVAMPVTRAAKLKTVIQMFAIGCLIVGRTFDPYVPAHEMGVGFLWIAAGITIVTGYDYMKTGFQHMSNRE